MNDISTDMCMKLITVKIETNVQKFDEFVESFLIYNVFHESFDIALNQNIIENLKQSKAVIIDQFPKDDKSPKFFIICFSKTIIIIEKTLPSKFKSFFNYIKDLPIHFLANINEIFNQLYVNNNNKLKADNILSSEIYNFIQNINISKIHANPPIDQMIHNVLSCIIGYLICESYAKSYKTQLEALDHMTDSENYISEEKEKEEKSVEIFDSNDFIELRNIGNGSVSSIYLYYQISSGELVAIKNTDLSDTVNIELMKRENKNYLKIDFPLLPKYIGKIRTKNYPIIQFINGQNLLNIKKMHLNYDEKLAIIFQIMMIIDFLHCKGFVYRDLKPDNVMIDENKTIFIIDFDRMLLISDTNESQEHTHDLTQYYAAPEISNDKISFKNDIYSIGKMIYYIINEKRPPPFINEQKIIKEAFKNQPNLSKIYNQCTNIKYDERPSISELMFEFYSFFRPFLNESFIHNVYKIRYFEGIINYEYEYISKDLEKSIHYLSFAANQNDPISQYILGKIYYEEVEIDKNIAIDYFTKAANQNEPNAQYYLGYIISEGKYLKKDMRKAIELYTKAATQNNLNALCNLGFIYVEGKYITRNIDKGIEYLSKAANQNHLMAQYNLGCIYWGGIYVTRDVNKGINYFLHAADQNHILSLVVLGIIFLKGLYVTENANKAIYYLTQAANQNYPIAQYHLGEIYLEGIYTNQDINKSVYYYTLAADQNHADAQNFLGILYTEGKYIERDIKKAIYYFTLAAEQNHSDASNNIGKIYSEGKFVPLNIEKALHYYMQAANQNHPDALNNIGVLYVDGIHVLRDVNKGIYYLTRAANLNHQMAQYNLGHLYYDGAFFKPNINKAIYYLTLAANQNHPNALYILSCIYRLGKDIEQDINKGIYYLTAAANQNDLEAQLNLGVLYYYGEDIPRNIEKALYYFKLAADRNNSYAQYYLGCIYLEGHIPRDINKAIYYFFLAANKNNPMAQTILGILYYDGKLINANFEKAFNYLSLAANKNFTIAQYFLGFIYTDGKYIARDIDKAIYYYSLAAHKYDKKALLNLGIIYAGEYYVRKDISKAIHYLSLASYLKEPFAQYLLYRIFSEREFCSVNMNKAIYYLKLSAENHFRPAQLLLGDMYLSGKYVNQDIANAIKLYKELSSFNNQFAKNNLGVIYKNGLYGVKQNIYLAKEYFYEAIEQKNDYLAIYNLSNILIEEEKIEGMNKCKSIESLIKSMNNNLSYRILLCLIVYKKYESINLNIIENEIKCYIIKYKELAEITYKDFESLKYHLIHSYPSFTESSYQKYKRINDYVYINRYPVSIHELDRHKTKVPDENKTLKIIDHNFYEGFGNDL